MKATECIKEKIKKYLDQRIEVDRAYNARVKELKEVYNVGTGSRFIEEEKQKCEELEQKAFEEFKSVHEDFLMILESINDRILMPIPEDTKALIDLYGAEPETIGEAQKQAILKKCGNSISSLRYLYKMTGIESKPLWAIADDAYNMIIDAEEKVKRYIQKYNRCYNDAEPRSKHCDMITLSYVVPLRYNYEVNCLYKGYPFGEIQKALDELEIDI